MKLWTRLIRWITAWAWDAERKALDGAALLKNLVIDGDDGRMEAHVKLAPGLSEFLAHSLAEQVASAPNYVEMQFTPKAVKHNGKWTRVTVTIQKHEGQTPHQLRQQAERERDTALAELNQLREKLREKGITL